jgi:NADP-dependent alcohol dehydrogenase
MDNFTFFNPTRIVFGTGTIAKLSKLVPKKATVLHVYTVLTAKRSVRRRPSHLAFQSR